MSGDQSKTTPSQPLPPAQWSVREEGNKVIIEFTLRDNYEAIEFCEVVAAGMNQGRLEFEFDHAK